MRSQSYFHVLIALCAVGLAACEDNNSDDGSTTDTGVIVGGDDGSVPPDVGPDIRFIFPDAEVIEPDMAVVEPDMAVIEPDMAVVEPDMAVVEPDMAVIDPDMAVVDPDMAVVEPDMAVVDPDGGPIGLECPADDAFEENDDIDSAAPLPADGTATAIACPDDADYFEVQAQAGCTIFASLRFRHAEGDLDLRLRNAQGGSLARGASADDDEDLEYLVGEDAAYFVEVRHALPDDDGTRYDLDVEVACPMPLECPADDVHEDNDDRATAVELPADGNSLEAILCDGDADFYAVQLGPECALAVELEFDGAAANLDLVLRDATGEEIGRSADAGDRERLDHLAGPGGEVVFAEVVGASNSYRIRGTQDCPIIPTCPEDDALEDNDDLETAGRIEVGSAASGIVCDADEDWFAIEVPEGCGLNIQLDFDHEQGDLDLHLHLPGGGIFAESVGDIDNELIRFDDAGGMWFLRVDLKDGVGANRYRLRPAVECPGALECPADDGFEDNDLPGNAPVLFADAPTEAIACLDDADYFAVQVPAGCDAVGTLDFDADGDLALDIVDLDANLVAAGAPTPDGVVAREYRQEDGRVYFEVRANAAPNDYQLTLDAVCPEHRCPADDDAEPNNDAAGATAIDGPAAGVVCGDDSDWFVVDALPGCVLRAHVAQGPGDADLELTALAGDAELARVRADDNGDIVLDQVLDAGGEHHLRLANLGGVGQGSYTIAVDLECVLACPGDDLLEDNDDRANATPVADGEPVRGVICGDDSDWFAIDVDAGCRAVADLDFDADGALDMRLTDGDGNEIDVAVDGRVEHLTADAATLFYEVSGAENDYELRVGVDCPEQLACPDDDALEDNDGPEDATAIEAGDVVDAIVCGRDHDWYVFEADAGCTVDAQLTFVHNDGDIDLRLYQDPLGVPFRSSTTPTDDERVAVQIPATGTWYLDVALFQGDGNDYRLDLVLDCPDPLACPDDDDQEPNDVLADATPLLGDRNARRGIACLDDADWYAVDLFEGCGLQADVGYDAGAPTVELRDADGNRVADGAQANDGQVILYEAPAAGRYYVYIEGDGVEYRLRTEVDCLRVLACPDDDGYEPNDDQVTASILPEGGVSAILCGDNADYWRVPVEVGCRLNARIEFEHAAGDIDLALVDNQGEVLAASDTNLDNERVSALLPHFGPFALRVTGKGGALDNTYRVSAELDCSCVEDGFEENDALEDAAPLAADQLASGRVCGFDEDWFVVETPEDCEIQADLAFAHEDGNLELDLRDEDGQRLAFSRSSTDNESITHRPEAGAGRYFLRVSLRDGLGANPYDLQVGFDCSPPPPVCFDDIFEENDGPGAEVATGLSPAQLLQGTACRGDEDWFRFEVVGDAETCPVQATLLFTHADGNLSLQLTDDAGAEIASANSVDDNEIVGQDLAPGAYHVRVRLEGEEVDGNAFGIRVDVQCEVVVVCEDDPFEPNNVIDEATDLPVGPALAGTVCGDDDDFFEFDAPVPGCDYVARMRHVNADGDLDLRLLDGEGAPLDVSQTAADLEEVTGQLESAGPHFLRVYLFGEGSNDYTVEVALDCPVPLECPADDALEDNDDIATATTLDEFTPLEGIVCAADVDVFEIAADAGCAVNATLEYVNADGQLSLRLSDAADVELEVASTPGDNETIERVVDGAGPHYLTVSGAENGYRLSVDILCPGDLVCPDDDGFEENDFIADAEPIADGGSVDGIVCGEADPDYFAIDVEAGCVLSAGLEFRHAGGDLNLRVQNVAGDNLRSAVSTTDNEALDVQIAATGTYYLRVEVDDFAGPDQNEYTLSASIDCPEGRLLINEVDYDQGANDGAEFIEIFNAGLSVAPLAGVELELIDGATGNVYATIPLSNAGAALDAGQYLVVGTAGVIGGLLPEVLRIPRAGPIQDDAGDAARIVRRGEPDEVLDSLSWGGVTPPFTEGAAGAPADPVAGSIGRCANGSDTDENGVDFRAGASTAGLPNDCPQILACPADDVFEVNDDLETSAIIGAEGGAIAAIVCGGNADFYQFVGQAGCTARVLLGFEQDDGNLDLAVQDGNGVELGASRSDDDDEVVEVFMVGAGPFYPVVTGRDGATVNSYSLDIAFECVDGTPRMVVNELDYDQPRSDSREFVELYNGGDAIAVVDGMSVDLLDAAGEAYLTVELADVVAQVPPGGFIVVGTARSIAVAPDGTPSAVIPSSTMRNGVAGVRLRLGNQVVDQVSYEGVIDGVTEGAGAAPADDGVEDLDSLVRCADGVDTDDNATDFTVSTRTPGRPNICQ